MSDIAEIVKIVSEVDGIEKILIIATLIVLSFLEIGPTKTHLISKLLRWVGKTMFSEIEERIDDIINRINFVEKSIDENEADGIRWEILNFANSCRHQRTHTKDEFEHVLSQNKKYERLVEKLGIDNGVYEEEFRFILREYHRCMRYNDFLV